MHSKPLITPAQNYSDFFNESTVMVSSYFLFLFTDYTSDASMSDLIGWSLVVLIAFNILINGIQILVVFVKNIVFKLKLNYLRWFHKKLTKKVQERRIEIEAERAEAKALEDQLKIANANALRNENALVNAQN